MELWSTVRGFPLYAVSNQGRILSLRRGTYLKLRERPDGYLQVRLRRRRGSPKKGLTVHRIVARAFIGPRPEGLQIAHRDGVKSNNRVENLMYATAAENASHKATHGTLLRGEAVGNSVLTAEDVLKIRRLHAEGVTQRRIAEMFGTHFGNINAIIKGKSWKWL